MLGEAVNLHRRWPRAVIGYLFMMSRIDESVQQAKARAKLLQQGHVPSAIDQQARNRGEVWFRRLGESVSLASDRTSEVDYPEKFEVVSCSLLDFDAGPPFPVQYHELTPTPDEFFDRLVEIHNGRFG
jgi:hypothetical protein